MPRRILPPDGEASNDFITEIDRLGQALRRLRITKATEILGKILRAMEVPETVLDLPSEFRAKLLVYLTLAGDINGEYLKSLRGVKAVIENRIPQGSMRLCELASLGLCEGLLAFYEESYDKALRLLIDGAHRDIVRSKNSEMNLVYHYYLARCYWRKGAYKEAIYSADKAREQENEELREKPDSERVALIDLLEGYLLLLEGDYTQAEQLLRQAEVRLRSTDDHINLGNAISFKGQLYRRRGNYVKAQEAFRQADVEYAKRDKTHRNRARCRANYAAALRLQARHTENKQINKSKEERQNIAELAQDLRAEALEALKYARRIYQADSKGLGKCHYISALCHLDNNNWRKAQEEAREALQLGSARQDNLLMARALITLCEIKLEEPAQLANLTARRIRNWAEEALECAKRSNNRRVQARAHIWLGQILLRPPFNDDDEAKNHYAEAEDKLRIEEQDYLREDLKDLKEAIDSFEAKTDFCVGEGDLARLGLDGVIGKLVEHSYNLCGQSLFRTAKLLKVKDYRRIERWLPGAEENED